MIRLVSIVFAVAILMVFAPAAQSQDTLLDYWR